MSSVLKRSSSSNPVISWRRQLIEGVSLLETSPSGSFKAFHGQRWTDGSLVAWLTGNVPSASTIAVTLYGHQSTLFVPISVAPYSIIPSVMNWRFRGVLSNYHFEPKEEGKSLMNSSSWDAFNTPNTCRPLIGPVPDEGVASSSMCFSLLYIQCSFLILLHFIFADYWERQREISSLVTTSF